MKKMIGLVVIIAALVLGGFYGMGLITERTLKQNVLAVNQSNSLFADVVSYDRGWFKSTAQLNWRLHTPERVVRDQTGQVVTIPAEDYKIQMPLVIYHGPIIVADSTLRFGLGYAHSDIAVPQTYADKVSNLFTKESVIPKLNLSLFVNYLNHSHLELSLPGFKLVAKEGGSEFQLFGMKSDVSVSPSQQTISGSLTVDGGVLIKNNVKTTLGKVTSDYELNKTSVGLYLGKANMSLPSLVVTENDQKKFEVEQFDINSSSAVENDLFSSNFKTSLDKMTVQDKVYGPALLEVSIKNLDAQVLAKINDQANKMQQAPGLERQQAILAILPELPLLLNKGAQFEVEKLSFILPEGIIEGNLLLTLPKGEVGNPFQLLQKLQGHGKLKIPATLVKGVLVASIQQRLQTQPTLQQAMIQQMQNDSKAPDAPADKPDTAADHAKADESTSSQQQESPAQPKPLTAAEIEQQAITQADQKLASLVQAGVLSVQGNEYVIEMNLAQGQLTINGQPFNPAMIQF